MIPIKAPLQVGDSNPAVVNLQDALLALWENGIFQALEAPNSPTQEELDKLAEGIREEREKLEFGSDTQRLVYYFQLQQQLGDNLYGVVEEKTADKLNEVLKKLGLLEDETLPSCEVNGQVTFVSGKPQPGIRVRASYQYVSGDDESLGAASPNQDGQYEIHYSREQFARAEKGGAGLRVYAVNEKGSELTTSDLIFNISEKMTVNLSLPGLSERLTEFDRLVNAILPLLKGRGKDGEDLPIAALEEKQIAFLAKKTGQPGEHIALLVAAARAVPTAQTVPEQFYKVLVSHLKETPLTIVHFYGWFRTGYELATLWSHTTAELIDALKKAVAQNIIPDNIGSQFETTAKRVDALKAGELLKPAGDGQPASLGDLLGTIPRRLSPEKELIVASVIRDYGVEEDTLAKRLKEADFDDREIASVQVTQALGDLTLNHAPLVQALQTFRPGEDSTSLRFLASQTPLQWAELVSRYGMPASGITQENYTTQLERTVEAKFPTAVFAARVRDNLIPLYDPAVKTAADFLVANPALELTQHNVRAYINNGADMGDVTDPEELVNTLQRIQRVQKLSATWQEAGVLLNNNLASGLAIVQQGADDFVATVEQDIAPERARELYAAAQHTHDTTVAIFGRVITDIVPGLGVIVTPDEPVTEHPGLKNYPNLRELFGNLDACQCDHCQSVLSPAAYLVDVMHFLDPKTGTNALSVLLKRRPDIGDLELTCANTNTEVPYIDLVLEILENAVALPLEILSPYEGLRPNIDLHMPLTASADQALRAVIGRTAITIGEQLDVKRYDVVEYGPDGSPHTDFVVSDGARHWVLRYWAETLTKTPLPESPSSPGIPLNVPDFNQAITQLNQGVLMQTDWLVPPPGGQWDKGRNLPLSGVPVVIPLQTGKKWKVQYKRSVYVKVELGQPISGTNLVGLGRITLKSAQGQAQNLEVINAPGYQVSDLRIELEKQNGEPEPQTILAPLHAALPTEFKYKVTRLSNAWDFEITEWSIEVALEVTLTYVAQKLVIASLTYQSLESHGDLKASPENQNPEAYKKLDAAVYPWSLPFNLWLDEVRVFLERRGVPRRQLMEQFNPTSRLLADAAADAIAREVLGLSKAEADILATGSTLPASQWNYWGLKEINNSIIDQNDASTVKGTWIQVLTRVSILLQRSGLSYRELLNVLETRFVRSISPALAPGGSDCNTSQMALTGLNPNHLDRIQRFVRLWRKLGWSLFDLDLALAAVTNSSMDLSPATLRGLSHIQRLHELLGLPVKVIVSWQGTFFTATYTDRTLDKRTPIKSIYERLFQNAAIQNPLDPDFALRQVQLPNPTKTLAEKASVIMAALGLRASDFASLMATRTVVTRIMPPPPGVNEPILSLTNLASLYRHTSLAKALRLTIDDYLRALALIDTTPFQSLTDLIEFVEAVQYIRGSRFGLTFEEIEYLLSYRTQDEATLLFSPAWAEQTLTDLRTSLQTVQREVFNSADLRAEHMGKMLARLGWYPLLIDEAVALLGADTQFEVQIPARTTPLTVTIPNTLTGKVSYQISDLPLTFAVSDVVDTPSFITQLLNDTNPATNPVSTYVWGLFAADAKQVLTDTSSTLLQRQSALVQQLNLVIQGSSLYDATRFSGVSLRVETQALVAQNPTSESLIRLNRLLLEDAYATQLSIRPRESKLVAFGTLKAAEWATWLAANTSSADVTTAINRLRTDVDAFVAALPAKQHHLQSFDLPTFRVSYPTQPAIPAEMSARCYYDQTTHEVVFVGWMTAQENQQLTGVLPTVELQALQTQSVTYTEPEGQNFFLSLPKLELLFEPGQTPDSRISFILTKLAAHFYVDAAVESLSTAVVLEQAVVHDLLVNQLDQAQTLDALRDEAFIDSDSRTAIKVSSFPLQFQALCKLHKAALLSIRLKLKTSELAWLPAKQPQSSTANVFGTVVFNDLSVDSQAAVAHPVTFAHLVGLLQLFELRDKPQIGADLMAAFLKTNSIATLKTTIKDALRLAEQDVTEVITRLNLTWRADYLSPTPVYALMGLLLTIQRLSVTTTEALSLTTETAATATARAKPGLPEAVLARNILRARYDASAWPENLKPIMDVLREKQRAALVAYLVARDHLRDPNDLYDRYLIDVEMSACKTSTRILLAISAVQLFIQRCLMHLESEINANGAEIGVSPVQINSERWKWMKNYRVWEANRKVFLYPENWIEPELRDDKSEIFRELEGQLLQDELDDERAEEILKGYLKQLEGISRLAIVGMFVEKPVNLQNNLPTGETIIHIVGRTQNSPAHFFYRRWIISATVNRWTPWERVPLDGVKTDHILPFILRGEVYIAWPEITQLAAAPDTWGNDKSPGAMWRIQMSWIRHSSRGWSDRFMSAVMLEYPWIPGKDANETFMFRVLREQAKAKGTTSIVIDCLGARDPANGNILFSAGKESTTKLRQFFGAWDTISLQDPWMTVKITGKIAALYKDGSKSVYRYIHGATVKVSLQITSPTATDDFDHEFFWQGYAWPNYAPYGVWEASGKSEWMTETGTTGPNGDFSVSMLLAARAMYRPSVRDSNPQFKLEVTGIPNIDNQPGPTSLPSFYFDFAAETKPDIWLDVTFRQNFEIPRSWPPPGTNPERSLPMDRIAKFELLDAEDAKFEPVPSLLLTPPGGATAHASGYLTTNARQTDSLQLPNPAAPYSPVSVWTGVAPRYSLLPSFPADDTIISSTTGTNLYYLPPEVTVYTDQNSTYFIRRKSSSNLTYEIQLDSHPRAHYLRLILGQGDKQMLLRLAQQEWSDTQDFDGHTPANVIDTGLSLTRPAIRFEPDQAKSSYASYNAELFFHVPFLIANFLSSNQQFEEAQQWFHLIFDPTTDDPEKDTKRYWRYSPFRDHSQTKPIDELLKLLANPNVPESDPDKIAVNTQIDAWLENPFRPHAVARLRPRAYEFAVVFKYLDNLIAWGDQLFRQSTTESINEATQLYILAAKLLGPRPQNLPSRSQPPALTYRTASKWDKFSNAWVEVEANLTLMSNNGKKFSAYKQGGSHIITSIGMVYFCVPANDKMLTYWDTVEDRVFKIRHCLNIEGVEQQIPLFQPPIDPGLLVRAVAAGLDIGAVVADVNMPLPFYRFSVLAQKASELCSELKALGGALLSALEKKDAEQLSLLRSGQEIDLLKLVTEVKQQQIEEAKTNLEALYQSEQLAGMRFLQYQRLLGNTDAVVPDDPNAEIEQDSMIRVASGELSGDLSSLGMIQAEQEQIGWSESALQFGITAGIHNIVSGIGFAIPDVSVGTPFLSSKFGGTNLGSILNAGAAFWNTLERNATHQAGRASTIGQYQRRQDEWVFQSRLALKEIQQVRKQIAAAEIRKSIAEKELTNHQKQIKNAEDNEKFMREKYTNRELYSWMVNQIMGVYFQTYQLAYDVAKRAERAFRHELGVQDSNFVKFGYWDSLKKGLMVGDRLYNDLKRMEVAYLDQNKREFELTKHISLLQLDPLALVQLRETGRCFFDLPEAIFDLDYPGHYFRRIKSVSLTLPCVVGPYTTISCTLRLVKNSIRINTANGDNGYPRNTDQGNMPADDTRFIESSIPVKAIAGSSAQNDSGMFELNFRDERYLPFEGAGAVSGWSLELFNDDPSNNPDFGKALRQFDYSTISDAILHVKYTAREDAGAFKNGVTTYLREYFSKATTTRSLRMFNLRQEFPSQWYRFLNPTAPATANIFELQMLPSLFPLRDTNKTLKVNTIWLLARCTDDGDYSVTLNPPVGTTPIPLQSSSQYGDLHYLLKDVSTLGIKITAATPPVKWQIKLTRPGGGSLQQDPSSMDAEVEDVMLVLGYEWE